MATNFDLLKTDPQFASFAETTIETNQERISELMTKAANGAATPEE